MVARYVPSVEGDILLGDWWARLSASGEIDAIVPRGAHRLGAFVSFFQPPTILLAEADGRGLSLALWAKPWCDGAMLGLWARADRRKSRGALREILTGLRLFLLDLPVLLVLTKAEHRARGTKKALYEKAGVRFGPEPIPAVFNGTAGWLGYLTREALDMAFPMMAEIAA